MCPFTCRVRRCFSIADRIRRRDYFLAPFARSFSTRTHLKTLQRFLRSFVAMAMFVSATLPNAALAQATTGTVSGSVVTQENGLGVSGATVELDRGPQAVSTKKSDDQGHYVFADVQPGIYSLLISATGYSQTRVETVAVAAGATAVVRTPLVQSATGESSLRVIGSTNTTVNAASKLAASSTIQFNLDPQDLALQGFTKAADALGQVPGVNISGSPHSVGDDTSIDIRGLGQGEVRPLLDGHPIGPIGVFSPDYYNYANSPYALLQNIQVTVGSGSTGLYGVDVIGGTIDFQTLQPTTTPHALLRQEVGTEGTLGTVIESTGTVGHLGYAFGHSVEGTYGNIAPQAIVQGARPNNNENLQNGGACLPAGGIPDVTSCNTALNTYTVSQDFKELNDLAKLRYNFTPTTALTLTAYDGEHHSDSTGNGDDDYVPYATQLAAIQSNPSNCGTNGYLAVTNGHPNGQCLSAQQLAQLTSGPDGGGANRNRGTSLQDFSGTLTTQIGDNYFSFNTFSDYYNFHKYSAEAGGYDATGTFFVGGGTYQDDYLTHGFLLTDDIPSGSVNDFGFGYFVEHQNYYGDSLAYTTDAAGNINGEYFSQQPTVGEGDFSFFIRDNYTPTDKFGVYLNAWERRSSVTQHSSLDPRLSFVFKPTKHDVVRLTGGEADGDPSATIVSAGSLTGFGNPSSLNPVCDGALNAVATGGNSDLLPERSKDLEAAYGHSFSADTQVNVVAYVSSVSDQLFQGTGPITAAALANPSINPLLGAYATKINSKCGTDYSAANVASVLGLSGTFNASTALYRGIDSTARIRLTNQFAIDLQYDIQSAQQFGEPVGLLITNEFLLNGGQIFQIPLQKGSIAFDFSDHRGLNGQLQMYYVGNNNTLNRPAYEFANGFISKAIGKRVTVALSGFNIFNSNAQDYGYFGEQLPHATNQFAPAYTNAITQYLTSNQGGSDSELDGLQGATFSLQFILKI
jgi:outer membrane receptor for ferrienterochelin and colicin